MKKFFILYMSCFLLFTFTACDNSIDNNIEPMAEKDINSDIQKSNYDNTKDITDEDFETNTDSKKQDFPDDCEYSVVPDPIVPNQEAEAETTNSPDAYRKIYAQKIADESKEMSFSLIYLNDDAIPDLVVHTQRSEDYSIYTIKDGALFCFVDSIRVKELDYYEKTGIICEPRTSNGGGDTGGYAWYYYQVSTDWTITNNSNPTLIRDYQAIYDEDNHFTGEGKVTYSYLGQEIDEAAYEDTCRNLGIANVALGFADVGRNHVCQGCGIGKEAAIQLLSRPNCTDTDLESSGNPHDSYWELYKKKLEETTGNIMLSFIYLDDDDIPELAICEDDSSDSVYPVPYSIYTVKDGELFCIVDSIWTESLSYCERQGIIEAHVGWQKGSTEKKDSYYQTLADGTLTNDSQPILECSNDILYDEDGNRMDEDTPSRYCYMGQDTDQATYNKMYAKMWMKEEEKGMCWGNALEKEIALELLNP